VIQVSVFLHCRKEFSTCGSHYQKQIYCEDKEIRKQLVLAAQNRGENMGA